MSRGTPPDRSFKPSHSSVIPTAAAHRPSDLPLLFSWWLGRESGRGQSKAGSRDGNQDWASHLRSADGQATPARSCRPSRGPPLPSVWESLPSSHRTGKKSELLFWDAQPRRACAISLPPARALVGEGTPAPGLSPGRGRRRPGLREPSTAQSRDPPSDRPVASCCRFSVARSCLTLATPWTAARILPCHSTSPGICSNSCSGSVTTSNCLVLGQVQAQV